MADDVVDPWGGRTASSAVQGTFSAMGSEGEVDDDGGVV